MENLRRPHDFAKNCNSSIVEDNQEKVKDFVHKHLGEVTDDPLSNAAESPRKDHSSSARREKQLGHCKVQQRAVFSGKILSFGCSVCKDNLTFSPNDLLKHFQAAHKGTPPTYTCELCDFVTNEFQVLQRHRIEHRNTLVTCELCNDNVQYSLLLLTRHYMMCHSVNGQFKCDWCSFTTVDAGTFVQHIHHHNEVHWKCSKCRHISLNEEDHQRHVKAHSDTFTFTCQICGYGAARSEYLKIHTAVVHREEGERRNALMPVEDGGLPDSRPYKGSCESLESLRIPKSNCLSESQNGRLIKQESSLKETHLFMDLTVLKKCSKTPHNTELLTPVSLQEGDTSSTDPESHTNGLTVLMVKNKISLPPNCTTKVMGFKMVDGKKHLVLKVIPTTKQDLHSQSHSLVGCMDPMVPGPVMSESKVSAENEQSSDSTPHCLAGSPRNGCTQMDHDDIMAIKVKLEEEETSVFSFDSTPNNSSISESTNISINSSLTSSETLSLVTKQLCDVEGPLDGVPCTEGSLDNSSVTASCKSNATNHQSEIINSSTLCDENVASVSFPSAVQKTKLSKSVFKESVKCGGIKESLLTDGNDQVGETNKRSSNFHTFNADVRSPVTAGQSHNVEIKIKKCSHLKCLDPLCQTHSALDTSVNTQNIPNQEVFTFHNYSKEVFSTSPSSSQTLDNSQTVLEENGCESPQFNLTLAESPEHLNESTCGEVEVDGCVASVDQLLNSENSESVLQDFNIIKIEEDFLPISVKEPETKSSSSAIGNFVEEHANAIITQQLNKEKTGSLGASSDSLKPAKTTLQILQLPDGTQPVFLRATENRFIKAAPGFKLLTSSTNPQINVSYMKNRLSKSGQATGVSITPNTELTPAAKPQATEKGTTLSAVKPGVRTTSNHYLINSHGFSGPVILSSSTVDKMAKAQPTCFLVQRSVPLVQAPSTTGFKLASTQVAGSSQPVLAMPVSSVDKSSTPQIGRQAFLLRYISPPKSSMFLNNVEGKTATLNGQTNHRSGNKVLFKIVTPAGSLLSSGASTTNSQPLFLTTTPQAQCILVSSNKTNATASAGAKNLISSGHSPQNHLKNSGILTSHVNGTLQPCEAERFLAPRPVRPLSQSKRRRKALFVEHPATAHKARRLSSRLPSEKQPVLWKPVDKEMERTLRLAPFSSMQQIKCPRTYQPVVVLNHPDADIPEVANIMKVVNQYKGAVSKVSLSENTVQALSGLSAVENCSSTINVTSNGDHLRPRTLESYVRKRFLLKMKLRKKSKRKYEVVKELSDCQQGSVAFSCWFCGRLFNNQEDWIGHGQRHLMEATRDWNALF
uniref:C2H2-type domain-containing protein n=1 Tax=Nothobranchius rachovii TaxID=451742 RepID=A0A1A8P9W3_9TELE